MGDFCGFWPLGARIVRGLVLPVLHTRVSANVWLLSVCVRTAAAEEVTRGVSRIFRVSVSPDPLLS